MYGLRRVASPITSWVLSACTIHLLNLPNETAANNLTQGLHDLEAMSVNHAFAARAIDIIRSLSSKWTIALPEGAAAVANYRMAGGRKSPVQMSFFAASIPRKTSSEGRKPSATSNSSAHSKQSPFSPPTTSAHQQQQPQSQHHHYLNQPPVASPMAVLSDPSAPLDPRSGNFWTPFPTQAMPMPQQHEDHSAFDYSNFSNQQQWQSYEDPSSQSQQGHDFKSGQISGRVDENMGGVEQWHWD
jgi:hypothetical protein